MDRPSASNARDFFIQANFARAHPGVWSATYPRTAPNQSTRSQNAAYAMVNTLRTSSAARKIPSTGSRNKKKRRNRDPSMSFRSRPRNQDYILAKRVSWSPLAQQNVAGNTIRRFCDRTGFTLNAPMEPTHFHKSLRNTVIYLTICKGMTVTDIISIPEFSSDHNPVLFESLDNFTSPALRTCAFPKWNKFQNILTRTSRQSKNF
ncbi:hypothetical protein TNCT_104011 [Trichonephila clavata]|uniref:Endonuclease/exonuclease/phosphatase domain-containing protein n=1 Tax=Trichonephila clavata TaxID=2740835 RepID=A0A8X6KR14_TRICU|nr:hypothetical protein TNCT_104011 [Trichonephila clavata]